jgi:iron-sulfur cluster repair protein YtfE (RIC family)
MHIHDIFIADHKTLRQKIAELQSAVEKRSDQLETLYLAFQKEMRDHFRKEDEVYYPYVDGEKKIADRELMHTLRNDHAAVVFALESLAIRLRRKVPLEEWAVKFDSMIQVLLPHFDHEEKNLFPEVEKTFPASALQTLLEKVQALE